MQLNISLLLWFVHMCVCGERERERERERECNYYLNDYCDLLIKINKKIIET